MRNYYPFVANLDTCYGSFDTFGVPSSRICVANKTEDVNLNVFNIRRQKQLNFCCTGPTNPNFWQIKITIVLISHINIFFTAYISPNMIFFFEITIEYIKDKNLVHCQITQ